MFESGLGAKSKLDATYALMHIRMSNCTLKIMVNTNAFCFVLDFWLRFFFFEVISIKSRIEECMNNRFWPASLYSPIIRNRTFES